VIGGGRNLLYSAGGSLYTMSPNRWYAQPHVVRIIRPTWGECLLCGERRDKMVWVKGVGLVCPGHEAYAVVCEYDDGYYTRQTIVKVLPTEEGARRESKELNRTLREARVAVGWRPQSYTIKPLMELVGKKTLAGELEEGFEESW